MGTRRTTVAGIYDNFGSCLGAVPTGLVTITADTEITDYSIIAPTTNVTVYFSGDTETTATLTADNAIAVSSTLRLSADTVCWVA